MKRKVFFNMIASFTLDITSLVCAFILPRLIIVEFGSEYNGIVSSVTQFLSAITLLRSGVGGVTRAALYKPLVNNDEQKVSAILKATEIFMRKISYIYLVFLFLFATIYPLIVEAEFEWFYSFSLILILGISTFAQYYFGITYQFLLQADQRQYIYNFIQMGATILNTLFSIVLINKGIEFRTMKLISSIIFAMIPIALYWYVHQKYTILKNISADESALKQRWDAFAHQIAAFIHNNTDVLVLTLFTDLYQVSVYSIYYMVVNGVKKFVMVFSSGIESLLGHLLAKGEKNKLQDSIEIYEWIINFVSIIAFSSTAILIVPFMQVYMKDANDANYMQPLLGYLLCIGFFWGCIRLPYQNIVEAAGHFKKTRNGAVLEALINITISIILVGKFESIGVLMGTIVAMLFRTVQYAQYVSRHIICRKISLFYKRLFVSVVNIAAIVMLYTVLGIERILLVKAVNYISWFVEASIVFCSITVFSLIINAIAYISILKRIVKIIVN